MTASHATPSPAGRGVPWPWLLALVPFLVLAAWHWPWTPRASDGDFAQYLGHARALLAGRPYTDFGYLYVPDAWGIGPPAYPPGLPLLLAPIVAVGGIHSPLIRLLSLAALVAFSWFAWRRLSRDMTPWHAAFAVAVATIGIEAAGGTLVAISDIPFCAILWYVFFLLDRDQQLTWSEVAIVSAAGFVCLAFRIVAIALVPGILLYAIAGGRRARRAFIPPLVWTVAGAGALAIGLVEVPYADGLSATFASGVGYKAQLLAAQYRYALFEAWLYPSTSNRVNDAYHVVAALLSLAGGAILAWRMRRSALLMVGLCYALVLAVAPGGDPRYFWPFIPVFAAALAIGTTTALGLLLKRGVRPPIGKLAGAGGTAVVLGALVVGLTAARPFSIVGTQDATALYAWVRQEHALGPVRAIFHNPRVLALEAEVSAMGILPRAPLGQLIAMQEQRITHLVWQRDDVSACPQRLLNQLPTIYPRRFALAWENPTFRVYRVLPGVVADSAFEYIDWNNAGRWCPDNGIQRGPIQ